MALNNGLRSLSLTFETKQKSIYVWTICSILQLLGLLTNDLGQDKPNLNMRVILICHRLPVPDERCNGTHFSMAFSATSQKA